MSSPPPVEFVYSCGSHVVGRLTDDFRARGNNVRARDTRPGRRKPPTIGKNSLATCGAIKELGVTLVTEWIVVPSQAFRADCDIILDAIADPQAQADTGLRISKPYRSGVRLAVPRGSTITSFAGLNDHTKVGVLVGSV